jgi:hypothetical protein
MSTNTLLFNLCNAVKQAKRDGQSKDAIRQDLDMFFHELIGDGTLQAEQLEPLLQHAMEVQV